MKKIQFRDSNLVKKVSHITYCVDSPERIEEQAHVQIVNPNLYNENFKRPPVQFGLHDQRLGTNKKNLCCATCGKDFNACVGHFGYILLQLPVFHSGYFKSIIKVLQTICKTCSHVLLPFRLRKEYICRVSSPSLSYQAKKKLQVNILDTAKKITFCPHCHALNGNIRQCGFMKIAHAKSSPHSRTKTGVIVQNRVMKEGVMPHANDQYYMPLDNTCEEIINPLDVLNLFERIPNLEIPLLMMNTTCSHPRNLILTKIPVPPSIIRPSKIREGGTVEDDLTLTLSTIVLINNVLSRHWRFGAHINTFIRDWDFLQLYCALYISSDIPDIPSDIQAGNSSLGLVQRLKGKDGRFRGSLSGKRVNFSGRTVITPDPNLQIDQIGVPLDLAKILTYPQKVTRENLPWMRYLVKNGPDIHPGANAILNEKNSRKPLKKSNRKSAAYKLTPGDTVERHLMNGDVVLFNRQPSLHKLSIMAHRAKVLNQKTFCFNLCVCSPYNADFDGDEMNLHFPQTEEARAEACVLMANTSNLVTPRNGVLLVAATQDFITGAYLLTQKDLFLDKGQASQLAACLLSEDDLDLHIDLPPPTILKPFQLWTGKQIFSLILRPNKKCNIKANVYSKGLSYTSNEEFCTKDSYVFIRNSEHLAGTLDRLTLGPGSKSNIFYMLLHDWGQEYAAKAMWRLGRVTTYFLSNKGFSTGIGDVTASEKLLKAKQDLLNKGYVKCDMYNAAFQEQKLLCLPACTKEESLEAVILKELSLIRDYAGIACFNELHPSNSLLIMAQSGSKGSSINISQMIACVGQQAISGHRVENGFENRSLPHFEKSSKFPVTRGFVENSFRSGLTPIEFYFHAMSGREGLIDTSIKTSLVGYMQRRLVKSLEDLCVQYDGTVRTSTGKVVQFVYGDDGLDPTFVESETCAVNFLHLFNHVRASYPCVNEAPLDGPTIVKITEEILKCESFSQCSKSFKFKLKNFVQEFSECLIQHCRKFQVSYSQPPMCVLQVCRCTLSQLLKFLDVCQERYERAKIEPGTPVGVLAAQSIGEPGTQMTLKAFHYAGVASMNITQGVPRLDEIMNATKNNKTPVIMVELEHDSDITFARKVKNCIEPTTLGQICCYIDETHFRQDSFLLFKLDTDRIRLLQLDVSVQSIKSCICKADLKIKAHSIHIVNDSCIAVKIPKIKNENLNLVLSEIKTLISNVIVKGLPSVTRALILHNDCQGQMKYKLCVEGDNLIGVMTTFGVKSSSTITNNIYEVFNRLGIEAARLTIVKEIRRVMEDHDISVDLRHLSLVADLMTFQGRVLGITWYGIYNMRESVLNIASFERPAFNLFEAAYFGYKDQIVGVSESIIVGNPVPVGTGMFKLISRRYRQPMIQSKPVIFDRPDNEH